MKQFNLISSFADRKRTTLSLVATSIMMLPVFGAQAAYTEPKNFDSLPMQTIAPVKGDDSKLLQKAIDKATKLPSGGKILLKQGRYQLNGIHLKPNVHLLIEKDTILEPFARNKRTVNFFQAGLLKGPEINNISVRGVGGRFKILLADNYHNATRAFLFGNINNLLIQDFDMLENYTKFSTVAFVVQRDGKTRENRAKNVTIRNATLERSNYGYGLIQVNTGTDMLFENLVSKGAGVTVRLEADLEANNKYNIGIHNVKVNGATCVDGHAALFMQPHAISNGLVQADGINSIRCGVGVFVQKNHGRFPGLPDGTFAKGSYVKDINVTFGEQTPLNYGKRNQFLPKPFYNQLTKPAKGALYNHLLGPSLAAVINMLPEQVSILESDITINGEVTSANPEKIVMKSLLGKPKKHPKSKK